MLQAILILVRRTLLQHLDTHFQHIAARVPKLQRLYVHLSDAHPALADGPRPASLLKLIPQIYQRALNLQPSIDVRVLLSSQAAKRVVSGAQGIRIFEERANGEGLEEVSDRQSELPPWPSLESDVVWNEEKRFGLLWRGCSGSGVLTISEIPGTIMSC
jgi:hypothetical protein